MAELFLKLLDHTEDPCTLLTYLPKFMERVRSIPSNDQAVKLARRGKWRQLKKLMKEFGSILYVKRGKYVEKFFEGKLERVHVIVKVEENPILYVHVHPATFAIPSDTDLMLARIAPIHVGIGRRCDKRTLKVLFLYIHDLPFAKFHSEFYPAYKEFVRHMSEVPCERYEHKQIYVVSEECATRLEGEFISLLKSFNVSYHVCFVPSVQREILTFASGYEGGRIIAEERYLGG